MSITGPDLLVAIVLIGCVPLQYFIAQNWSLSESGRNYALKGIVKHFTKFREKYFQWEECLQWFERLFGLPITGKTLDDYGESPAIEVMKHKQKDGYFGFSTDVRSPRSQDVQFRVGQVIYNKSGKYRGVIVGWDEKARASDKWFEVMHEGNMKLREIPNYSVLVDVRDRLIPQYSYVPQENVEILNNVKIVHPLIENYFENFDGAQYIPRPWLKTLYPED